MRTNRERFWGKVDKSGECWLWTGRKDRDGYGQFDVDGKVVSAHRFAFKLAYGDILPDLTIDHRCHVRHCVNVDHLRESTVKENLENQRGAHRNSKSGIRGVSWHAGSKKWRAQVWHNRVNHEVGRFDNIEDAEAAVVAKRLELFTHNDLDREAAA